MGKKISLRHPGLILRDNIIERNGLTVTEAAALLKVTRPALSNVLNGRADISPEMSLRVSRVFGGSAEEWMRLQGEYDLERVRGKVEKMGLRRYK